jgi:lipopolysaccharide export system protein LptA
MTGRENLTAALALLAVACFAADLPARAQTKSGASGTANNLPSAFQGFQRDSKDPVQIEANSFEVFDKDRYAIFVGNVVVTQGESTMRARELKVFYVGSIRGEEKDDAAAKGKGKGKAKIEVQPAPAAKSASDDPAQRVRRIEAHGGVIITNKDQKATGDFGVLDMPTNTATITGNVVLTQGPNVMRADSKSGTDAQKAGVK